MSWVERGGGRGGVYLRLESRELLPGHVSVTPILFGDPAYPLLLNVMKEFNNCTETKHVLFDNKLRATRYQIECAFERLKSRWRVLNTAVDVDPNFAVKLVYACFILNNFSACNITEREYCMMLCKRRWEESIWFSHVHIMIILISSILIIQAEANW